MPPAKMHAVLLTGHGGPAMLEYRSDVAVPEPGPGQVLIRVRAAAVNNTDINLRTGWYSKAGAARTGDTADPAPVGGWGGSAVGFPLIQGADACGEIAAVGAGVPSARIGERVLVDPILRPEAKAGAAGVRYMGSDCNGAFADYLVVPTANALRIDCTLSDAELASFPCSYLAAENMVARAGVCSADTVLITGASGGVGTAAIQLARRRGARVKAVAGAEKAAAVKALGAEEVMTRNTDLVSRLGKESVDVVIDVVGGSAFTALLEVLRREGRYAVAGAIDGALVTLDLRTAYLKDLTLYGCTIPAPGLFASIVRYIEAGEIHAVVAQTFALRDVHAAQKAFLDKAHVGKIVLVP